MKNVLALILAAALMVPLAACGGEPGDGSASSLREDNPAGDAAPATKKEMLAQAEAVSMTDMIQATLADKTRARERYCDQILIVEGDITERSDGYTAIGSFDVAIRAALSGGDSENLRIGQRITVVGRTGPEICAADSPHTASDFYEMPTAYLVKDTVEWTGEFKGLNGENDGSYNLKIGNNSTLRRVYFAGGVSIPERDAEITVSGICIDNDLYNAIIVK